MTQAYTQEATKFNFKARTIYDEAGNNIGKAKKQPAVVAQIPRPTAELIIAILSQPGEVVPAQLDKDGNVLAAETTKPSKIQQLILDQVFSAVTQQARAQFDEVIEGFGTDDTKTVSAEMLDYDKLTLEYIATIEPAARGGSALAEEDWKEFFEDYCTTIMQATGRDLDRIKKHIAIFERPNKIRYNKDAQKLMLEMLDVYRVSSARFAAEETMEACNRIYNRLKKWFAESDQAVVDAL